MQTPESQPETTKKEPGTPLLEIKTEDLEDRFAFWEMDDRYFLEEFGIRNRFELAEKGNRFDNASYRYDRDIRAAEHKLEILKRTVEMAHLLDIMQEDIPFLREKVKEAEAATGFKDVNHGIGRDNGVDEEEQAKNRRVLPHSRAAIHRLLDQILKELRERRKALNEQLEAIGREENKIAESQRQETHRRYVQTLDESARRKIDKLDRIGR